MQSSKATLGSETICVLISFGMEVVVRQRQYRVSQLCFSLVLGSLDVGSEVQCKMVSSLLLACEEPMMAHVHEFCEVYESVLAGSPTGLNLALAESYF
jgi:hypothetical protein